MICLKPDGRRSSRTSARWKIMGLTAFVVVASSLFTHSPGANANVACEYLEPGQPIPPTCEAERQEEEASFKRLERERQEQREREAAEEAKKQEEERKEERERKAEQRREEREAREWAVKPKVTMQIARFWSLRVLHKKVPTWTYRKAGSLQCGGGRISRSQWRCRVSWIAGSVCHAGRVRVIGAGHEDHRAVYRAKVEYRNGYGYVRHGRIRCFLEEE